MGKETSNSESNQQAMSWLIATLFYIGGVAMTFVGVPIAILMGAVMLIGLPLVWAINLPQIRRERRRQRQEAKNRIGTTGTPQTT